MEVGPRLLIHFDVDQVMLEGVEERINVALANSAVIRRKACAPVKDSSAGMPRAASFTDYVWHDGTPLDLGQRADLEAEGKAKTKRFQLAPPRLLRTVNSVRLQNQ